jgi:cation:H+ antiporter
VSGLAAIDGNTGLSIGNAIGSNIFNIALVLGVCANHIANHHLILLF